MNYQVMEGDCISKLRDLPSGHVHCCVTSPPYYRLRDYGVDGQIGLEESPEEFVAKLVDVFREVRRVLRDDGTLWLNLGDGYSGGSRDMNSWRRDRARCNAPPRPLPEGMKAKQLLGIPWRVALALQADGWYLRQDIIWAKPNPMPESVRDRCTKSHEYLFLLTKSPRYFFDSDAIREPHQDKNGLKRFAKSGGNTSEYKPELSQGFHGTGFMMKPGHRNITRAAVISDPSGLSRRSHTKKPTLRRSRRS